MLIESSNGAVPGTAQVTAMADGNAIDGQVSDVEVSVIMPCLNEEASLKGCIDEALGAMRAMQVTGEVIVVDNGSTDASIEVAMESGARVVVEGNRGYGSACRRGLHEARGRYLVLGDSDGTYDFGMLHQFVHPLRNGVDVVLGNRLTQDLEAGAMPWLHRRIGNPFLTNVLNLFFETGVSDAHCGLRSISREAYSTMNVGAAGMEFASEFLIEAIRNSLRIAEVPIRYRRRSGGEPKLRAFRDGWRHLRLMLSRAVRSAERHKAPVGSLPGKQSPVDSALQERL